jgi:hypothetical protein
MRGEGETILDPQSYSAGKSGPGATASALPARVVAHDRDHGVERGRGPDIRAHATVSNESNDASIATLPSWAHQSARYTGDQAAQRGERVEMGRPLRIRPMRGFHFPFFILFFSVLFFFFYF